VEHGLPVDLATRLAALVFTAIAASALVHGVSVTPLMNWYGKRTKGSRRQKADG
jgi:NhaP-type Na+/H+ or K+/H+ antiporter